MNGNSISSIEVCLHTIPKSFSYSPPAPQGLDQLGQLKDLNLSGNQLTTIGSSLSHLSQLETLNLSGNKISSLIVSLQVHTLCARMKEI